MLVRFISTVPRWELPSLYFFTDPIFALAPPSPANREKENWGEGYGRKQQRGWEDMGLGGSLQATPRHPTGSPRFRRYHLLGAPV